MYKFVSRIINYFVSHRKKFFRYFLVGSTGFILDITTLFIFKEVLRLSAVWSVVVNQLLVIGYIFLLNKFFSFGAFGQTRRQLVKFMLVFVLNYVIAIVWMWGWHEELGFNYLWVRTANVVLSACWNFALYQKWVYRGAATK